MVSPLDDKTHVRMLVDPSGRPYALFHDLLVPLQKDGQAAPFKASSASSASGNAWVDEGVLLLAVGRELGIGTPEGFLPLLKLPADGMHVGRAGSDRCWIFGGDGSFGRELFLYVKGGELGHVLRTPEPLRAVAGSPDRFVVATAGSVVLMERGAPPKLLFDSPSEILSLDVAEGGGLFFSLREGLFFRAADGHLTRITRESPADLRVAGDAVYLLFDGFGIVRGSPISALGAGEEGRPP